MYTGTRPGIRNAGLPSQQLTKGPATQSPTPSQWAARVSPLTQWSQSRAVPMMLLEAQGSTNISKNGLMQK